MSSFLEKRRRRRERAMKTQFRDDEFMIGSPDCSIEAFKNPRLRQCPFDLATISWEASLGGGLDGYVWKVRFGDGGPFALKVFWDTRPLAFDKFEYHAVQRECHNAALLQMMEASVAQATPGSPILVNANPVSCEDAKDNHYAFSQEGRVRLRRRLEAEASLLTKEMSKVPRLKQCYGWLNFSGQVLRKAPLSMWPPSFRIDKLDRRMPLGQDYIAIVYEFVEEGPNDHTAVGQVLEFLWLTGFSLTNSTLARNWESGVLIDLADIVSPRGYGWERRNYGIRAVDDVLR